MTFRERVAEILKAFSTTEHPKYPAGTPGGLGGKFMPTGHPVASGVPQALYSPGTSNTAWTYNDKLKQLHAAMQHPTDPVSAIEKVKLYGSTTLGYAKKFNAIHGEALGLAKAQQAAIELKNKPLPPNPVFSTGYQHGQTAMKYVEKLKQAAQSKDPVASLSAVKVPASVSVKVHAYKADLLTHFGQGSPGGNGAVMSYSPNPAITSIGNQLHKTALVKPEAPKLDTSFPADQQALFQQKIKTLETAFHNKDVNALAAVPAYSPSLATYKSQLQTALDEHLNSGPVAPKQVGAVVSKLKVVAAHEAYVPPAGAPKTAPDADYYKLRQPADTYRKALPAAQSGALNSYAGSGYHEMNGSLRAELAGAPIPTHTKATIKQLDHALLGYQAPAAMVVHRGLQSADLANHAKGLIGHVIEDPAYISTSTDSPFGGNVKMHFNIPAGVKGCTGNLGEHEWVLPRKTRYKVTAVVKQGTFGETHIYADVLPHNEQPYHQLSALGYHP